MENKFEMLTAVDTADRIEIYTEALDQALGIKEVTNIAITGSYGSGKSSFLRTYEKNVENNKLKFLNISLATFKDINRIEEVSSEDGTGNSNPVHGIDNSIIEKSILQQIFYRVKDEEIPESRFKQIKSLNLNEIKKHTLFLGYMIIFPLVFFYIDSSKIIDFLKKLGYPWFSSPSWLSTMSFGILILFFVGLLAVYLYKIIKHFSAHNISKVNFKKAEMEVNKQDEKSILNEYLDEILYFFEVTKYNVVVIEDLDRFKNTEIFIKLRELNKLLNDSEQVNNRIVFIYAIRDDMFTDKSRTKFFDFLIPIIPYINPSNSYSKLLDLFSEDLVNTDDRNKPLSKSFLRDISLYIDDMRLLTSVHNEYLIYKSQVCGDNADYTKILAMMVYKNFYPNDFSKLHLKKGILYNFFTNKNKYIECMITEIEGKIEDKSQKIQERKDKYKDEKISNINELRTIYLANIYVKVGGTSFYINGQNYNIVDLGNQIGDGVFTVIKEASDIKNQHNRHIDLNFKSIEQEINANLSYNEREAQIMGEIDDKVEIIKKEIVSLKNQIEDISLFTISEILEHNKDSINIFKDLDEKYNLLKYLIMYEHINEDYYDYISHFFEGAITIKDRDFLQSLKINNIYPFNYSLEHIEEVVKQLEDKDFKKESILNFSLLEYLSSKSHSKPYKLLLKKLSDGTQQSQNFILEYMDKKDNANKKRDFIHSLVKVYKELWVSINESENLPYDKKVFYLEQILHNSDIEDIKNLNHTNELTQFINKLESLELFSYFDRNDLKELYSVLNIKFEKIKDFPEYLIPFDVAFENRNYQLNEHMIDEILSRKIDVSQYKGRYYTTILESEMKLLVDYVNENLNEFIENVLLNINKNTQESEEVIIGLLNTKNVSMQNKSLIIEKEEVKISVIDSIEEKSLWKSIFKLNKVIPNWDSILFYYYEVKELDNTLIDFINNKEHYKKFSQWGIYDSNAPEKHDPDNINDFIGDFIVSNAIDDEAYKNILKSFENNNLKWSIDDIEKLTHMKICSLFNSNRIIIDVKAINYFRMEDPDIYKEILEKNIEEIIIGEEWDLLPLGDDILCILKSKNIATYTKIELINKLDYNLYVDNKLDIVSDEMVNILLNNSQEIDIDLFETLFNNLPEQKKQLLFIANQVQYWDELTITDYLERFDKPYTELAIKSHEHLYMEKNEVNEILVNALDEIDYISSVSDEKKKLKINRKRK